MKGESDKGDRGDKEHRSLERAKAIIGQRIGFIWYRRRILFAIVPCIRSGTRLTHFSDIEQKAEDSSLTCVFVTKLSSLHTSKWTLEHWKVGGKLEGVVDCVGGDRPHDSQWRHWETTPKTTASYQPIANGTLVQAMSLLHALETELCRHGKMPPLHFALRSVAAIRANVNRRIASLLPN